MKAYGGSRSVNPLTFNLNPRCWVTGQHHALATVPLGQHRFTLRRRVIGFHGQSRLQGGEKSLVPAGIQPLHCSAHSLAFP